MNNRQAIEYCSQEMQKCNKLIKEYGNMSPMPYEEIKDQIKRRMTLMDVMEASSRLNRTELPEYWHIELNTPEIIEKVQRLERNHFDLNNQGLPYKMYGCNRGDGSEETYYERTEAGFDLEDFHKDSVLLTHEEWERLTAKFYSQ